MMHLNLLNFERPLRSEGLWERMVLRFLPQVRHALFKTIDLLWQLRTTRVSIVDSMHCKKSNLDMIRGVNLLAFQICRLDRWHDLATKVMTRLPE